MPYVINGAITSARWVDTSENYTLKDGETFSDVIPQLNPLPAMTAEERLTAFRVGDTDVDALLKAKGV